MALLDQGTVQVAMVASTAAIPVAAGLASAILLLKRRSGRIRLQRVMIRDDRTGLAVWKLLATASGRHVRNCGIEAAGKRLAWDGIGSDVVDLGEEGGAVATIPFEVSGTTVISVRSGGFQIFRGRLAGIEELHS